MAAFTFEGMPRLVFGAGTIGRLPELAAGFGARGLLVTGGASFDGLRCAGELQKAFGGRRVRIEGEPSPGLIDEAVERWRGEGIDVVAAVGGGAAIDGAKAISAMLRVPGSVKDYLEGVGDKTHPGIKTPFIAAPTTAGTGAEATKNSVISSIGPEGFKKSLRHDLLIPDLALIDPELALTCPASVTAACGMDALTQLIEAYTSPKASPMTDSLAWAGMEAAAQSLPAVCGAGASEIEHRGRMAWAAFLSGVCLAHAGLGVVHALASPIGGLLPIAHGVVCGSLLAPATRANVQWLMRRGAGGPALAKYAAIGRLLSGRMELPEADACEALVERLEAWTVRFAIPRLDACGMEARHMETVLGSVVLKTNPAALGPDEIRSILAARVGG